VVDWGIVCLLAAYCGSNSPLARALWAVSGVDQVEQTVL